MWVISPDKVFEKDIKLADDWFSGYLSLTYMKTNGQNKKKDDIRLVDRIRKGDALAFEELFFKYYSRLCGFAVKLVKSPDIAKDCVQEVFLKIWRNRKDWSVYYSLSVYLYQAVRNQALNQLEKSKTHREYSERYYEEDFHNPVSEGRNLSNEEMALIGEIWKIVEQMPQRRKMVFELHRKHGLSYKEIAQIMDITRKTVENHMGKALQDVRDQLNGNTYF
ncbi:MAG TPA: RNA polymerase sigma-70 factor [Balneolaceae bacterium]|nr:RNA polymerase sigma-70 factor [Balneolaceae bacterium]